MNSKIGIYLAIVMLATTGHAFAHGDEAAHEKITPAFRHALPNAPGKVISSVVVEYQPGQKSLPHRHGNAFVVAYVLEGAIKSSVNGGPEKVYRAGESWAEKPGDHHTVSANASDTEPAKLLAIFIADKGQKELVTFDKQ
ncbi:MAG TPA: cupin domain-containing protein [Methylophilaceae bacterium]|nr:cupin domain-containing protein [Methylophilaceae bacterium]